MGKLFWAYILFLALMVGTSLWANRTFREVEYDQVSFRNEIERGIEVKGLENKFIVMRMVRGLFGGGGAGAGGLGAPQVFPYSAEQFVELVPSDEPIYTTIEWAKDRYGDEEHNVLKKVYWAFIEDRAGVMVYEDVYSHDGFDITHFDNDTIYFKKDNQTFLLFVTIFPQTMTAVVLGFVVFLVWLDCLVNRHKRS